MKDSKKFLIYGLNSYKNKGCEALARTTIDQVHSVSDSIVTVASYDMQYNKTIITDQKLKYVNHYKKENELTDKEKKLNEYYKTIPFNYNNFECLFQSEVVSAIKNNDICISIGGDNYCYNYNHWLYALNNKAKELDKKTVLWGVSLFDEINDTELISDLNKYDVILIRESISYNAVKKYVNESKLILAPDPAFSLDMEKVSLSNFYDEGKVIGLNVSPLTIQSDDDKKAIYEWIDYILEKTDYKISLISHVTVDDCNDMEILTEIAKNYKKEKRIYLEKDNYNCMQLKYIISKCDMLLASRTHASIAAYSTCVPTLVIGYSVKSRGIAKDIFGEIDNYVISKDDLKDNILINKFNYIIENQIKIKSHLEEKMKFIKKESSTLINKVINKLKEQDLMMPCLYRKCSGCSACINICPVNAITMIENEEGFLYPKIDLQKCIHCDLCKKICPQNSSNKTSSKQDLYMAINKDRQIQKESSSGGIFTIIANSVLNNDGIVYGVNFDNNISKHVRITSIEDLKKIRGSKYSQSVLSDIFKTVKNDLQKSKNVLFSGTPCQIGGLKAFLQKDYKNLLTVEVVCHGVIPNTLVKKRLNDLNSDTDERCVVNFRTKKNGWTCSSIEYIFEDRVKINSFLNDSMMWIFLKNISLRESCYNCKFKNSSVADIILGDYWGIEVIDANFFDKNGVTALILNTEKARRYFEENNLYGNMIYKKGTLKKLIPYNPSLVDSSIRPLERDIFYVDLKNNTIDKIVDSYKVVELKSKLDEKDSILESKDFLIKELNSSLYDINSKYLGIIESKRWKKINGSIDKVNKILGRK